ncbi:MAG: hypothetical protein ABL986_05855 [Vicinamibacterales bacterium]
MSSPVILLEFNELSPTLMSRFIGQGHLPNFKKFADQSATFVTEAAERPPYLDPWIQWVTVHTGLNYTDHKLEHLDEGHTLDARRIWDYVSEQGDPVWVCGSMNVGYRPGVKGAVMPDPWASHAAPTPAELGDYYTFVQRNVQEYTNDRVPLTKADYLKFLAFMASHGLSSATVTSIGKQLLSEKRGVDRWKRAVILDKLQFDVFKAYYRKIQPRFSTFFLNSTAHYQHMYWRDMEPELFKVKQSVDPSENHDAAILFGYQEMDQMVGRFVELAGADTTIVFATALSQQPYLKHEEEGGRHFYRPSNIDKVVEFAGVAAPYTVAPVMAHQFHLFLDSDEAAVRAEQSLLALTVNGRRAMNMTRNAAGIIGGCMLYDDLPGDTELVNAAGARIGFFDLFYKVEGMKSGMHHPDGLFWVRQPGRAPSKTESKVPLQDVAPTLLDLLGIQRPSTMNGTSVLAAGQPREPVLVSK